MISTVIIDDEPHCIRRLEHLLLEHFPDKVTLQANAGTLEEGLKAIEQWQPGLVFLDVQLHDRTGFDLLRQLDKISFEVIFTTAYEQYAIQAFRFSALDYLLKPVDAGELGQALQKTEEKGFLTFKKQRWEALFKNLENREGTSQKICVPVMNGFEYINTNEIIRCESTINYTTLFLKDKNKLIVARTLKEFEELLGKFNFFRIHQSHLVNLANIKSYRRGKGGGSVIMDDKTELEVSVRRKELFLSHLKDNGILHF